MARSVPSYVPIARVGIGRPARRRQRGQRPHSIECVRQVGSGSPHEPQTGGVMGTMPPQQLRQTGPLVG